MNELRRILPLSRDSARAAPPPPRLEQATLPLQQLRQAAGHPSSLRCADAGGRIQEASVTSHHDIDFRDAELPQDRPRVLGEHVREVLAGLVARRDLRTGNVGPGPTRVDEQRDEGRRNDDLAFFGHRGIVAALARSLVEEAGLEEAPCGAVVEIEAAVGAEILAGEELAAG